MTTEATTYDKKFNAQRAGSKPGELKMFKTPDGRFGKRAITENEPAISITDFAAHAPTQYVIGCVGDCWSEGAARGRSQ